MALQESTSERRIAAAPARAENSRHTIPACPQCERRMIVKQVAPVLFASDLDDVIYGCETCGDGSQAHRQANLSGAHLI